MSTDWRAHNQYMIRRKILKLVGSAFHVYDPNQNVVLYVKLKAFKLKEDIRAYTGEDMQTELLTIKARQIIDIAAAYDVVDATTGEKIGVLKRKGLKSFIKDEWVIMDASDNPIGMIQEDSMVLALVRRFVTALLPQNFTVSMNGQPVCDFKRHFNPFVLRMDIDFSKDTQQLLDRRMGIAAAILMSAIEGRQG